MAGPKPCNGHPSRIEAVLALLHQNLTPREIADQLGFETAVVTGDILKMITRTRRHALSRLLAPAAEARALTPHQLAERLLSVVARDPVLLDNVLDDGVTTPARGGRDDDR